MILRSVLRIVTLLALAHPPGLVAQTPPDTVAAIKAADEATRNWLAIVDKGQVEQSWEEAALAFQMAVTKIKWVESLRSARGAFESFADRQQIMARYTTDLPNAPKGEYVVFQYRTTVAGGHQVIETVIPMRDTSRGWRVSGYFVRPDQ